MCEILIVLLLHPSLSSPAKNLLDLVCNVHYFHYTFMNTFPFLIVCAGLKPAVAGRSP
jgi:hypothetical protein